MCRTYVHNNFDFSLRLRVTCHMQTMGRDWTNTFTSIESIYMVGAPLTATDEYVLLGSVWNEAFVPEPKKGSSESPLLVNPALRCRLPCSWTCHAKFGGIRDPRGNQTLRKRFTQEAFSRQILIVPRPSAVLTQKPRKYCVHC